LQHEGDHRVPKGKPNKKDEVKGKEFRRGPEECGGLRANRKRKKKKTKKIHSQHPGQKRKKGKEKGSLKTTKRRRFQSPLVEGGDLESFFRSSTIKIIEESA